MDRETKTDRDDAIRKLEEIKRRHERGAELATRKIEDLKQSK